MSVFAIRMNPVTTPAVNTVMLLIKPAADEKIILHGAQISIENPAAEDIGLVWYFADDDGTGGVTTGFSSDNLSDPGTTFNGTILQAPWATTQPVLGGRFAEKFVDARVGWEFVPTPFVQAKTERGGLAADRAVALRVETATISQGALHVVVYVETV